MKRQIYLLFPIQADSALLFPLLLLIQIANLQYTIFAYLINLQSQYNLLQSQRCQLFLALTCERGFELTASSIWVLDVCV